MPLSRRERVLFVLAILGGLVAITQLWSWVKELPRSELVAETAYSDLPALPSQVLTAESLSVALRSPEVTLPPRLSGKVAGMLFALGTRNVTGFWRTTIRNTGTHTLSDVTLTIPFARQAMIEHSGGVLQLPNVHDVVSVGAIAPKAELVATAFVYSTPMWRPEGRIVLTHRDGVGRVKVLRVAGTLGALVDTVARHGFAPLGLLVFLVCTLAVLMLLGIVRVDRHGVILLPPRLRRRSTEVTRDET